MNAVLKYGFTLLIGCCLQNRHKGSLQQFLKTNKTTNNFKRLLHRAEITSLQFGGEVYARKRSRGA